ncbi:MAG: HD domain-containing protein [Butyrivibrio sp.]|jgi:putative nucleotidyltransferase with HDIG domain|nr:HD domain-containing protein [Butyrivibrio sp.]
MLEMMKKYHNLLKQDIYRGKLKEDNIRTVGIVGLLITFVASITTVMNFYQHKMMMGLTTVILALTGLFIYFVTSRLKNRRIAAVSFSVLAVFIFTYYTICGTNEGFATLWTILVPMAMMYFIGVRFGIAIGVYYLFLYLILFYTPLRQHMEAFYSQTFIQRFPILYMFALMLESVSMIQYHAMTLDQYDYDERLHNEVTRLTAAEKDKRIELEKMYEQMVLTLVSAIDAKDKYTNGHSARVSAYSVALARKLGWPEEEVGILRYEALLHDVGKIGIPDTILNKQGRLNDMEYRVIQSHTVSGANILENATTLPGAKDVALHHHERYDGKGYPEHLAGENISAHARVVSVMDAYDAMNSDRIYRNALPREKIIQEMQQGRGLQFDPVYLDVFMGLLEDGSLEKIAEKQNMAVETPEDKLPENEIQNLQELISRLVLTGKYEGAVGLEETETPKFYEYIRNFCSRYGHSFELVMITLRPIPGVIPDPERQKKAIQTMELAVKKTVRQADVISEVSDTQLLAILVEAGEENVDSIMCRIFANFYKVFGSSEFEPTYEMQSF